MEKVLESKQVSYGLVELVDNCTSWARYLIRLNGKVKEVSENFNTIKQCYDRDYH